MESMKGGIQSAKERVGADLVVVPKEYSSSIEDALFQGYPYTVYFEQQWADLAARTEGVEQVTPQVFLATLNAECCDSTVQLVGFDETTDYLIQPWLEQSLGHSLKDNQVVIGSNLQKEKGERVRYYGEEFEVAGILEDTGMGYDNCVFLSRTAAKKLAQSENAASVLLLAQHPEAISSVMIRAKEGYTIEEVKENLLAFYKENSLDCNSITIETSSELFRKATDEFSQFSGYAHITEGLLLIMAFFSLSSINLLAAQGRRKEFGIYISIGAGKKQIFQTMLGEAGVLTLAGGVVGGVLSLAVNCLFHNLIRSVFHIPYIRLRTSEFITYTLVTVLFTVVIGLAATLTALHEIAKTESISLIKENGACGI